MSSRPDAKLIVHGASPRGSHRLQLAAECLQKYAWEYEGPRTDKDMASRPALAKGALFHLAMAQHYARMRARQRPHLMAEGGVLDHEDNWCEPEEAVELIAKLEKIEQYIGLVLRTYRAYVDYYAQDEYNIKILGVEDLCSTKINGRYLLTGRLDLSYEDLSGRVFVTDHKCLPGSTRVLTQEGPKTVESLVSTGTDWTCAAWNGVDHSSCWTQANCPQDAGEQDVYELVLVDGTVERYGHRHPLLTQQGWKAVAGVRPGERVAITGPPVFPDATFSAPALRVLGLALSDGGRLLEDAIDNSYNITANEASTRLYLTDALDALYSSWATILSNKVQVGIRIHPGSIARNLIKSFGIDSVLAGDKTFPSQLLRLSKCQVGVLLGAFWEGDGAAYLGSKGKGPVRIAYSSRSRSLAMGVRYLLLQLGILSNVTESLVVNAPYFQTFVVGEQSKLRFLSLAIEGVIDCPNVVRGGRKTRAGGVLEPFDALVMKLLGKKKAPTSNREKNPRIEDGVRWTLIEAKRKVGRERCFDISVPKFNTFLTADCVVTHNTSSRITSKHKEFYSVSSQLLGYSHMARERYGDRFAGMIVNLVQLVQKEGDPVRFERVELPRSPNMETRFERNVVDIEESIERMQASGREYDDWPKAMNEMSCETRYGSCPFISKCRFGAEATVAGSWKWEGK